MLSRIFLAAAVLAVSACKLTMVVDEGGEVQSQASGTCAVTTPGEPAECSHDVLDTDYSETFTAVPDPGWVFSNWDRAGAALCQDPNAPSCNVTTAGLAGHPMLENFLTADVAVYVKAVFKPQSEVTDTVLVDGVEWAQPALFTHLDRSQIVANCPDGVCGPGAVLNGYDMEGWTWASAAQMQGLFNQYIGTAQLSGPAPYRYYETFSEWAPAFLEDFRPTEASDKLRSLVARVSDAELFLPQPPADPVSQLPDSGTADLEPAPVGFANCVGLTDWGDPPEGVIGPYGEDVVETTLCDTNANDNVGSWFFRQR